MTFAYLWGEDSKTASPWEPGGARWRGQLMWRCGQCFQRGSREILCSNQHSLWPWQFIPCPLPLWGPTFQWMSHSRGWGLPPKELLLSSWAKQLWYWFIAVFPKLAGHRSPGATDHTPSPSTLKILMQSVCCGAVGSVCWASLPGDSYLPAGFGSCDSRSGRLIQLSCLRSEVGGYFGIQQTEWSPCPQTFSPLARGILLSVSFLCILKINFGLGKEKKDLSICFSRWKQIGLLLLVYYTPQNSLWEIALKSQKYLWFFWVMVCFFQFSDIILLVTDSIILIALCLGGPDPNVQFSFAKILCSN